MNIENLREWEKSTAERAESKRVDPLISYVVENDLTYVLECRPRKIKNLPIWVTRFVRIWKEMREMLTQKKHAFWVNNFHNFLSPRYPKNVYPVFNFRKNTGLQ